MSVDLDVDNFDVDVTLVNGDMAFGFDDADEVARFLDFVATNPDRVYRGDSGQEYPCSLLKERYLDTGHVREPLGCGDLEEALRGYGWLREGADGIERMHFTRDL